MIYFFFERYVKGPLYTANELKMYLTQRVKTVLQGRARKIRKLMQEQQLKRVKYKVRAMGPNPDANIKLSPLQKRAKEIDPNNLFAQNLNHVDDDLFINSLFQFWTYVPPAEMAARIERAAVFFKNTVDISPAENLVNFICYILSFDIFPYHIL